MQTRQIDLVINKLTKAQYEGTTKNADELYITTDDVGLTSSDITTALGYTPYNASNPNGYTSNVGTVTKVNNVSPVNGNVTLTIPTVNDGALTIVQDNSTLGTFTANQSTNTNINVKGLYDYYTINANKQGSIVIDGANVSGFSANNLVWKGYTAPANNEAVAIDTQFTIDTLTGSDQFIFSDSFNNPNFAVKINGSDGCLSVAIGGTWYSLANTEITEGETYQVRLIDWVFTDGLVDVGTYLYVYSPSLNQVIYNDVVTSNTVVLSGGRTFYFGTGNSGASPLNGSIDLSQTYIEQNNIAAGGTFDNGWYTVWTGATPVIDTKADTTYVDTQLATKADTDLSNLTSTASKNFDGQWVTKDQVIASNVSFATGGSETKTYSLTNYLPNDGATYEVLFSLGGQSAATSGSSFAFVLSTDIVSNVLMCRSIARTAAYVFSYGNAIVPLTTRQVKVTQANNTSGTPTMSSLRMCGYRRVGTNS